MKHKGGSALSTHVFSFTNVTEGENRKWLRATQESEPLITYMLMEYRDILNSCSMDGHPSV